MTNGIFDTHVHYDDHAFDEDRDSLLSSFPENGIACVLDNASTVESHVAILQLTERYPFVYGTVGVHPDEVGALDDEVFARLEGLCSLPKIAAVGEIGLDYHWNIEDKKTQRYWFERFADLAKRKGLPVVIHSRDAAADTLDAVKSARMYETGAVMHCYAYSREQAKEYLDMGMHFGIGGVSTFKNAKKLIEVLEYIPMSAVLLETDCPYLAPVPYRGKRNCSLYLPYVAAKIAEIKGISPEEVIHITNENARNLFRKCV